MKIAGALLAIALALALQTTLTRFVAEGTGAVDVVLVAVVYVALTTGPVGGMLSGTVAGLIQDTLSSGVIGIGGLAKTLVGFLVGWLGAQFIVTQPLPRFVMFVGATMVHEACTQLLYAVVEARGFRLPYSATLTQAAVNALVGVLAFQFVEHGPQVLARRRSRSASLGRRHY